MLPPLYARQEPTADAVLLRYCPHSKKRDTVIYQNRECTQLYVRWAWHVSRRPTKRTEVVLNYARWRLEWLPTLAADCQTYVFPAPTR